MRTRPRNTWLDEQAQRVRDAWPQPVLVPWAERYETAAQAQRSVADGLRVRLQVGVRVGILRDHLRVWCADVRRPADALRALEVEP